MSKPITHCLKEAIICLYEFGKTTLHKNPNFVLKLVFINYFYIKLKKLLKVKLKYLSLPDKLLRNFARKHSEKLTHYVDYNSCTFASSKYIQSSNWYYICSIASKRKYKIFVIPQEDIPEDIIYLSETLLFNINNHLGINERNYSFYFLISTKEGEKCAQEASVSLITSTNNYSNDLSSQLLENYFRVPRYLRGNDVFDIDVKEFAPEFFYSNEHANLATLYFKVKSIDHGETNESYVIKGETTLIQEGNVQSYIPPRLLHEVVENDDDLFKYEQILDYLNSNCPPCLNDYLLELKSCIAPFLQKGKNFIKIKLNIKPVFLLQGPQGCGKFKLIQSLAKSEGLHLIESNFADTRTLATAQTETKIRMTLQIALNCVPCILMLRNIQLIGFNAEGKKDERAIASFSSELANLFARDLDFPLIIVATSEESEIPVELENNFIETITIKHITKEQKYETLLWLLKTKGIGFNADLKNIVLHCSDFGFIDLEALVLHATKNYYKSVCEEGSSFLLTDDHFNQAYEWMQRAFSDEIGAPRIPKVHWEDIGGLADLKHELARRIQLPLLESSGIQKSGLLLYGPPGTGKTLLAKAVATECQFHFLSVKGPELLNMYVGQSEQNVRQVFEKARAAAPCIIFFDELDSLAPNRGRSGDNGGVMDRVVSQLLTEMDGLETNGHIIIIGATNRPDLIDPALLRPGRFDKMLYVGMYDDKNSQLSVLKALSRKFNLERDGEELEDLVQILPSNLTGADLYAICSDAWLAAVRKLIAKSGDDLRDKAFEKDPVLVCFEDFKDSLKRFKPSVSVEEMAMYERMKQELT